MDFKLKYGTSYKSFSLEDKNIISTLNVKSVQGIKKMKSSFLETLDSPIACKSLKEITSSKAGKKTVIVVSDYTRGIPYKKDDYNILEYLIDYLNEAGVNDENISLLVGGGTHRPHTEKENLDNFGKSVVDRIKVLDHDCDKDVKELGVLPTGNPLLVNHHIINSDIVILTSLITTHYFAGFSGGRKTILPSVAGRETIRRNHAMVLREGVGIGKLAGNPISEEMDESIRMVDPDFIITMIVNDKKEIAHFSCGHYEKAYIAGYEKCSDFYIVNYEKKADACFISAGGYPKDANLLQVQKTLNNGKELIKKGGTLVILAECSEGIGSPKFQKWLSDASSPKDLLNVPENELEVGGHTAVNTAKQLHNFDIVLVTDMPQEECKKIHFNWEPSIETAIERVKSKHGENFSSYVVPFGGLIFPVKKN